MSALYGKRSYKDSFSSDKIQGILVTDAAKGKICRRIVQVVIDNFDVIIRDYEKERNETMERYMEINEQYENIYERFKGFDM